MEAVSDREKAVRRAQSAYVLASHDGTPDMEKRAALDMVDRLQERWDITDDELDPPATPADTIFGNMFAYLGWYSDHVTEPVQSIKTTVASVLADMDQLPEQVRLGQLIHFWRDFKAMLDGQYGVTITKARNALVKSVYQGEYDRVLRARQEREQDEGSDPALADLDEAHDVLQAHIAGVAEARRSGDLTKAQVESIVDRREAELWSTLWKLHRCDFCGHNSHSAKGLVRLYNLADEKRRVYAHTECAPEQATLL